MSETLAGPTSPSTDRDEELASARAAFRELDKAWRATRTYGINNAVTRRFFEQLELLMFAHLDRWLVLAVIVDRAQLRLYGESVYDSEDTLGESLAFRLYADGVREVRFEHGLSPQDLHDFLDALWVRDDSESADDDVVTRLWAKDLATITFVTAEDIVQAPWSQDLVPQEKGFFSAPPPTFGGVIEREKQLAASASVATGPGPAAAGENLRRGGPSGLVGFEVKEYERALLEREMIAENALADGFVLDMLRAIIASQQPPDVLTRALATLPPVFDVLLEKGKWPALSQMLALLETASGSNPAFEETHGMLAKRAIETLSLPQRVALFEAGLSADPERLDGLAGVCARLSSAAVGPLCGVLANLTHDEHRAALRDTLIRLGAENPEPVLKGLADPRPQYVLDLVNIIVAWQQPQAASVLSMLAAHADATVRTEALASIARLHQKGDGAPLLAFVRDPKSEVRLHALRLLASGRYAASWESWSSHLADKETLLEKPRAENRMLFHALRVTAREGAIPLWQELIEGRHWKQRQKKEETALLAVRELAALSTLRAWKALEQAQKSAGGAVKKAIAEALAARPS